MAEHDYVIANDTGANVRSDLNNALSAIVSNNSKATEPTTKFAYQWWADTGTGILKQRNAANNAWISILTLATGIPISGSGLSNIVEDTSPQLGGSLDLNSNNITGTGGIPSANLTGSVDVARLPSTVLNSNVAATDLTSVHQGIATLGLHMGVADNKAAFNLPNSFIDTFEDDTGIATETTIDRNASEYVSSIYSSLGGLTAVGVANFTAGAGKIDGWSWSGNDLSGIGTPPAGEHGGTTDGASTPLIFAASQPFEYHFVPVKSGTGYGGMVGIVNQSYAGNNFQEGATGGLDGIAGYMCVTAGNNNSRHGFAYVESSTRSQINTTAYSGVSCIFKRNASNYLEFWAAGSLVFTSTATHTFAIEVIISGQGGHTSNVNDQNYIIETTTTNATGTLVSTVQTAPVATTEVSGAILYKDNGSSATALGTHLQIWFTANLQGTTPNWTGTNWTQASSYGTSQTFSGTTKQVKLGKTTVTSGTQVAMKAVWASQTLGGYESQLYGWAVNY
jgi:hypothetical protein